MFKILHTDGNARRGEFHTVHGVVQTPVFQNVGTIAAIKGAVSTMDLKEIGCQAELSNTYHLHLRPGDKVIKQLGRLLSPLHSAITALSFSSCSGVPEKGILLIFLSICSLSLLRFEKNNRRRRQL